MFPFSCEVREGVTKKREEKKKQETFMCGEGLRAPHLFSISSNNPRNQISRLDDPVGTKYAFSLLDHSGLPLLGIIFSFADRENV